MTRNEFESNLQSLVGERIKAIQYYEVEYENGEVLWNYDPRFDSLDYGLDLVMESGLTKGIIWGSEFCQYGISMVSQSLSLELRGGRKIDVSNTSRWKDIIGREIENVKIIWSWEKEVGLFKKKIYYPQDLILTFSGEKSVFISAMEIREGSHFGMADNITVFFNKNDAEKFIEFKA